MEKKVNKRGKNINNKSDSKNNNKNNNKKSRKTDYVVISVLGCVIVFLLVTLFFLNNNYFKKKDFVIDYLKLTATNYVESDEDSNVLVRNDNYCNIILSSKITKNNNLLSLGQSEIINSHDWVNQEFENGITWMSYYKNTFYIVQMYSKDKDTYNSECKKDFEKIKKTFSFMKNE